MKANIAVDFQTKITKAEDGGYTAVADIFGAYGMGDTKKQAKESLSVAYLEKSQFNY